MIVIISISIFLFLIYYYPLQRTLALRNFNDYIEEQGTNKENIKSLEIYKDYKLGGYKIIIYYDDNPGYQYIYNYFPLIHRKGESRKYNKMSLKITDMENSIELEPPYNDNIKYKPLDNK